MGGLLDLGSLTAQLAAMDTGSLEAIRGYASGYIDGRVQALPQLGKVRSSGVLRCWVASVWDDGGKGCACNGPGRESQSEAAGPGLVRKGVSRDIIAN